MKIYKINSILISLLYAIRPLLGPVGHCRFTIGCTDYAVMQLKEQPIHKAIWLITTRLISCQPFFNFFS